MPVRSGLCAYSPTSGSSKYSSILPTASSLSYGHYKPLSSASSAGSTSSSLNSGSFRSTLGHQYDYPGTSTSPRSSAASTGGGRNSLSRYSLSGSPSYYSPTGAASSGYAASSACLLSSSAGLYKPLDSPPSASSYTSRYGNCLKASSAAAAVSTSRHSSSSSSNSLSSLAGSAHDSAHYSSAHKSPSSTSSTSSAYSSGSALSSTSSSSVSNYVPKSRRLSYTSYSTTSSLGSQHRSPQAAPPPSESPLPPGVPGGLINLGNTCYMNASLQSIYSIDSFRELILSHAPQSTATSYSDSGANKVLTSQLADLFKLMKANHSSTQAASPADFKYAFSRYQNKFSGFAQQDAQEFLRYLINGVHEEHNKAGPNARRRLNSNNSNHHLHQRNTSQATGATAAAAAARAPKTSQEAWSQYRDIVDDSPLVDLLVGQLCSTITCGQCGNKSHCWDPFWDLSLPLSMRRNGTNASGYNRYTSSSFNLRDVIDEFTAKETLDGDERPTCSHCKQPTRSTKQISWSRLPQVLILHLKKFTNDGYKLSSPDIQIDKQLTFNGTTYHLKASISHHGHSSCSGHYTSHCEYAGRWFHFDDAQVRDVTTTFSSGGGSGSGRLTDAYVLLYTPQSPGAFASGEAHTAPSTAAPPSRFCSLV